MGGAFVKKGVGGVDSRSARDASIPGVANGLDSDGDLAKVAGW